MTCECAKLHARIAELEEEVSHLKRELGQQTNEREVARITAHFKRTTSAARPSAARLVAFLYGANGRPVHWTALLETMPARDRTREPLDRLDNNVRIWVSNARKYLGKDSIATVQGIGYRLTETGLERVASILK